MHHFIYLFCARWLLHLAADHFDTAGELVDMKNRSSSTAVETTNLDTFVFVSEFQIKDSVACLYFSASKSSRR
jgi:hypothetical protein